MSISKSDVLCFWVTEMLIQQNFLFPPKHYSFSSMMIFNGGERGMELTDLEAKNKFLRILLYFELPLLFKLNSKNKCT